MRTLVFYRDEWLPLLVAQQQQHQQPDHHPGHHQQVGPLVPPIDVAWVWHCHRLAPLKYAAYCRDTFGMVLDPHGVDPFATSNKLHDTDTTGTELSPSSFYVGDYDLAKATVRQSSFLESVSSPLFASQQYLTHAVNKYHQFLFLIKCDRHNSSRRRKVPTIAIDLAWHTHQLLSTSCYIQDTARITGSPLGHDDDVEGESEVAKLRDDFHRTKTQWSEAFPGETIHSRKHYPIVIEDFISSELTAKILNQLPHNLNGAVRNQPFRALNMSALVPVSLKTKVQYAMFNDKSPTNSSSAEKDTVGPMMVSPVRIKQGPAPPHQDRYNGASTVIDEWVAIVYVKGSGSMNFVDLTRGQKISVRVKARSLIFFHNATFTHEVVPENARETRVMLGPFTFTGDDIARAGDCGGCSGCGEDCSSSSSSSSGSKSSPRIWGENPCGDVFYILIWGGIMGLIPAYFAGGVRPGPHYALIVVFIIPWLIYYFMVTLPNYQKKFKLGHVGVVKTPGASSLVSATKVASGTAKNSQNKVHVVTPPGSHPGDPIMIEFSGKKYQVQIPNGVLPGHKFEANLPSTSTSSEKSTMVTPTPVKKPDWVEYFDQSSGAPYWHNSTTGESRWVSPQTGEMAQATETNPVVTDRSGKRYAVGRLLPPLTANLLENVEGKEGTESVEYLRGILATIGLVRIESIVQAYDIDKSSGLDRAEFRKAVKRMTMSKPTPEQIQALENEIFAHSADPQHVRLAELEEFVYGGDLWLRQAFEAADIDHSGTLDMGEARILIQKIFAKKHANSSPEKVDEIVQLCMLGQEKLNYDEFKAWVLRRHEIAAPTHEQDSEVTVSDVKSFARGNN